MTNQCIENDTDPNTYGRRLSWCDALGIRTGLHAEIAPGPCSGSECLLGRQLYDSRSTIAFDCILLILVHACGNWRFDVNMAFENGELRLLPGTFHIDEAVENGRHVRSFGLLALPALVHRLSDQELDQLAQTFYENGIGILVELDKSAVIQKDYRAGVRAGGNGVAVDDVGASRGQCPIDIGVGAVHQKPAHRVFHDRRQILPRCGRWGRREWRAAVDAEQGDSQRAKRQYTKGFHFFLSDAAGADANKS